MSILGSGSGLQRVEACPASAVLDGDGRTTEASAQGTKNHKKIEDALASGDRASLQPVVRAALEGTSRVRVEPSYAINVLTGDVRHLGCSLERNYGELDPHEVALTSDLECLDTRQVWDWKSRERVTPVHRNLQLLCEGYAAAKHHGWSSVTVAIGYLDNSESDVCEMSAMDLGALLARLQRVYARVEETWALRAAGEHVPVHTGPWCEYCPAIARCPAHTRLARALLGETDAMLKETSTALSAERCGEIWEILNRADAMIERMRDTIKARAKTELIPLSAGKRLAVCDSKRTSVDGAKALAELERLGKNPADYQKTAYFPRTTEVYVKGRKGKK